MLLAHDATLDLKTHPVTIETPLVETTVERLSQKVALVPILRAGLGMVEPVQDLLPDVEVRHLGFYRDEVNLQPVGYYNKLPAEHPVDVALVLDPMLATGGSTSRVGSGGTVGCADHQADLDHRVSARDRERTQQDATVDIHVCCVDEKLNSSGFIVPGLGDAGDRTFGT